MIGEYIVGIDPDLTNQSMAVIVPSGQTYVIFDRVKEPKGCKNPTGLKLARATETIRKVVNVLVSWDARASDIHVYLEDQSMAHAKREAKINPQDLITTSHVSGIWSGMLSGLLWMPHSHMHLIKASTWKQQQTKWINQTRTLNTLGLKYVQMGGVHPKKKYPGPVMDQLEGMLSYTLTQPNPGDFKDISDSLGIALFGHKERIKERRHENRVRQRIAEEGKEG